MINFSRIVLAGGPASGKTEAWRVLACEFPELHAIPEAATLLINQLDLKLNFDAPFGDDLKEAFWHACWRFQELAERLGDAQARVLGKRGVLFDRALADHAAYLENGQADFFAATGLDFNEVFARYDLVVFLGGPESLEQYRRATKTEAVRLEGSFEESRELTERTLSVWRQHPAFHFVPYSDVFLDKLDHARRLIRENLYPLNL